MLGRLPNIDDVITMKNNCLTFTVGDKLMALSTLL